MPSVKYDLIIEKGATFKKTFRWRDSSGNVIVITGYTARMHIREQVESTATLLELTTENGRISIEGTEGKINLYISDIDTSALPGNTGVYDLELVATGGDVIKFIRGSVSLVDEVTR